MQYSDITYWHEPWYPMFLFTLAINSLVVWGFLVMDAIRRGYRPTDIAVIFGGIGTLIVMHPIGLATFFCLNLGFLLTPGLPLSVAISMGLYAFLSFCALWYNVLEPIVSRSKQG